MPKIKKQRESCVNGKSGKRCHTYAKMVFPEPAGHLPHQLVIALKIGLGVQLTSPVTP